MVETGIRRLLENAVNSSCKLAIVMVFAQHKNQSITPAQMSQRLCRDIWSIEEAMQELADDGILSRNAGGYHLLPSAIHDEALTRLMTIYDEPMRRQEIVQLLRELDSYAPYRKLLNKRETILAI